jgi:hypothetical protein
MMRAVLCKVEHCSFLSFFCVLRTIIFVGQGETLLSLNLPMIFPKNLECRTVLLKGLSMALQLFTQANVSINGQNNPFKG